MNRKVDIIKSDIAIIKQEIRYARSCGDSEQSMEVLYEELENLEQELHKAINND